MRLISVVLIFFSVLTVAGCGPSVSEKRMRAQLSEGVSGYTGNVIPIDAPITVKLDAIRSFGGTFEGYVKLGAKRSGGTMNFSGSLIPVANKFEFAFYFDEMNWGGQHFKTKSPLLRTSQYLDRDGRKIGALNISSPAGENGEIQDYREGVNTFKQQISSAVGDNSFVLYAGSYTQNTALIAPQELTNMYARKFPNATLSMNTISLRAIGLSTKLGRPCIVGQWSGKMIARFSAGNLDAEINGHALYDLGTGILLTSIFRVNGHAVKNNKTILIDIVSTFKIEKADFPAMGR